MPYRLLMSLNRYITECGCFDHVKNTAFQSPRVMFEGHWVGYDPYKVHICIPSSVFYTMRPILNNILDEALKNQVIVAYKALRIKFHMKAFPQHARGINLPYTIYLHSDFLKRNLNDVIRLLLNIEDILKGKPNGEKSAFKVCDIELFGHFFYRQTALNGVIEYISASDKRGSELAEAAKNSNEFKLLQSGLREMAERTSSLERKSPVSLSLPEEPVGVLQEIFSNLNEIKKENIYQFLKDLITDPDGKRLFQHDLIGAANILGYCLASSNQQCLLLSDDILKLCPTLINFDSTLCTHALKNKTLSEESFIVLLDHGFPLTIKLFDSLKFDLLNWTIENNKIQLFQSILGIFKNKNLLITGKYYPTPTAIQREFGFEFFVPRRSFQHPSAFPSRLEEIIKRENRTGFFRIILANHPDIMDQRIQPHNETLLEVIIRLNAYHLLPFLHLELKDCLQLILRKTFALFQEFIKQHPEFVTAKTLCLAIQNHKQEHAEFILKLICSGEQKESVINKVEKRGTVLTDMLALGEIEYAKRLINAGAHHMFVLDWSIEKNAPTVFENALSIPQIKHFAFYGNFNFALKLNLLAFNGQREFVVACLSVGCPYQPGKEKLVHANCAKLLKNYQEVQRIRERNNSVYNEILSEYKEMTPDTQIKNFFNNVNARRSLNLFEEVVETPFLKNLRTRHPQYSIENLLQEEIKGQLLKDIPDKSYLAHLLFLKQKLFDQPVLASRLGTELRA